MLLNIVCASTYIIVLPCVHSVHDLGVVKLLYIIYSLPLPMKITHHQLREGAKLNFEQCFKMEYRMSLACMVGKTHRLCLPVI